MEARKTVLVVDDDAAFAALVQERLGREGYLAVTAGNGAECLELVTSHSIDLIVMDLMMPVMGGMDAVRSLRDSPATRMLPVIILTGQSDQRTVLEGWMSGAERYLTKPLQLHTLVREVKRLLGPPPSEPRDGVVDPGGG